MTAFLLNKNDDFVGAKYISTGLPVNLTSQNVNIINSLTLFEQLPMIEKLKMFFTMGMIILDEEQLCLNVTALHYRVSNLKKLRSLMNNLIDMNKHEIPEVKVSNEMEVGFQMILKGITKIYESEKYDGKESTEKLINKLATKKMKNLLNEFCNEVHATLHPEKETDFPNMTLEEVMTGLKNLIV